MSNLNRPKKTKLKGKSWRHHLSLEKKFQANQDAYDYWCKNPHLNCTQVTEHFRMSEQKLRCWMRKYNKERPMKDVYGPKNTRHTWIVKAYNRGLMEDLTATAVSKWASDQSACFIRRGDIQYYAYKFNLPTLREEGDGKFLAQTSKYA